MSWFSDLFSKKKDTKEIVRSTNGSSYGGVLTPFWETDGTTYVSTATATEISTFYACIKLVTETIAKTRINIFKVTSTTKERIFNDIEAKLNVAPNAYTNRFDLIKNWVAFAIFDGEGLVYPLRKPDGSLEGLYLIDRGTWTKTVVNNKQYYQISSQTVNSSLEFFEPVPETELLKIIYYTEDGKNGIGITQKARKELGLIIDHTNFASSYFNDSDDSKAIIKTSQKVQEPDKNAIIERFNTSSGKMRGVRILENGMEYQELNKRQANDTQLVTPRKHQTVEICRFFSVPPNKVGHMDGLNYNSVEQLNIEYLENAIDPRFTQIELEINAKILFASTQPIGQRTEVKFDEKSLLRTDKKTSVEYYRTMYSIGAITSNQIRYSEDLETENDELADQYYSRLDSITDIERRQKIESNNIDKKIKEKELKES